MRGRGYLCRFRSCDPLRKCEQKAVDAVGYCSEHRAVPPRVAQEGTRPKRLGFHEVWCLQSSDGRSGVVEEWFTGRRFGRTDGPSRVRHFSGYQDGERLDEWPVGRRSSQFHRVGGPARVQWFPDETVKLAQWWIDGQMHRVDGPAQVDYSHGGELHGEEWLFDGTRLTGRNMLASVLLHDIAPSRLIDELERSSFAVLLAEGIPAREVVKVFEVGVSTADGIREVVGGAPVEWACSWETGQTREVSR